MNEEEWLCNYYLYIKKIYTTKATNPPSSTVVLDAP